METSHNYLFVSDLHLSEGRDPNTGKLSRIEDFFYDDAFARFIVYHVQLSHDSAVASAYHRPWRLVINGDIWDFLQVVSRPPDGHPLYTKHHVELTPNKKRYGLGTSRAESIWKLKKIADGHPIFFQALGWFLAHADNELILMRGNHDLELYWPEVQDYVRRFIGESYTAWREAAAIGQAPDTPLPISVQLLDELTNLESRIQFPDWYYYQPELFYVEHGNQYDPYNFSTDFTAPILADDPNLIELPRGSFFVRYLFNKIEALHPFADNMKPLMRYVNYVITSAMAPAIRILLIENPRQTWDAIRALWSKRGKFNQALPPRQGKHDIPTNRPTLAAVRRAKLRELQDVVRQATNRYSRKLFYRSFIGLLLRLIALFLVILALRHFIDVNYGTMALYLLSALVSLAGGTYLWRGVNDAESYAMLPEAALAICRTLNEPLEGKTAAVRYHIFGHDHFANVAELDHDIGHKPPFKQWYINTGSWLPSFLTNEERLIRTDIQLTFLRLVPSLPGFDERAPDLLEWRVGVDQPRPIQSLDMQRVEI